MAIQNITYDDKSYLNQNSSIADVNKVNDTDMNEIKSVVNNNATELETTNTNLATVMLYSSSEIKTGEVYVENGTSYDVYRKCFKFTPASGSASASTGITNFRFATRFEATPSFSGGTYNTGGFYNNSSDYARVYVSSDGSTFNNRSAGSSTPTWRIILEYTKTN